MLEIITTEQELHAGVTKVVPRQLEVLDVFKEVETGDIV